MCYYVKTSIRLAISSTLIAFGLVISITFPSLLTAYAYPDQICSLAGANSTMIQNCIHNFLYFQNMSKTSYQSMQNDLDNQRDNIRHNQVLQNETQASDYKEGMKNMSYTMTWNAINERQWYNDEMKNNLEKMMQQVKYWKTYDHNPTPQPNCPAWKECGPDGVPLNMTQLQEEITTQHETMTNFQQNHTNSTAYLKPEMYEHPSGVITENAAIKNWQDLENWFLQHQNSTSTH